LGGSPTTPIPASAETGGLAKSLASKKYAKGLKKAAKQLR
jgi:hypothetical protein